MKLIQALPPGPLDIVGDIHGEIGALQDLLRHLGYDETGNHPDGRTLVFVGDFCDRGPDSPAVLAIVQRLVEAGRAYAVLGNHEMNFLRGEAKDGSGWYSDARVERDDKKYAPYQRVAKQDKHAFFAFLSTLPIALERADLRVIHAAWMEEEIAMIRPLSVSESLPGYAKWDAEAERKAATLKPRMADELADWGHDLEDREVEPPFMHAHAEHDAIKQMTNPFKVLTSGVERKGEKIFYASGKWRFVERVAWWDEYEGSIPVVVGHYWRRAVEIDRQKVGKGDPDLFDGLDPRSWHGKGKVFCVDFSVGGRWVARKGHGALQDFKLAALQWPERTLRFDDGSVWDTTGFMP